MAFTVRVYAEGSYCDGCLFLAFTASGKQPYCRLFSDPPKMVLPLEKKMRARIQRSDFCVSLDTQKEPR